MELTEKNGQASMEEILASIRRIIAEEPAGANPLIDLNAPQRQMRGDGLLDDPSDFDLPSMFRAPAAAAPERPAPLFGRLSEAIRAASTTHHFVEPAREEPRLSSLKFHNRTEPAVAADDHAPASAPAPVQAAAPSFLLAAFHDTLAARPDDVAVTEEVAAHEADAAAALVKAAHAMPEVPRQMAAFKDTRFRGMGAAPQPIEPAPVWPAPVEATAAPLTYSEPDPMPALVPVEVAAPAYPAFGLPEPTAAAVVETLPAVIPPPPLPPPLTTTDAAEGESFKGAPIEDATADLLRPMLRQWLADNMPRMVEKALHIEVAETVKTGRK